MPDAVARSGHIPEVIEQFLSPLADHHGPACVHNGVHAVFQDDLAHIMALGSILVKGRIDQSQLFLPITVNYFFLFLSGNSRGRTVGMCGKRASVFQGLWEAVFAFHQSVISTGVALVITERGKFAWFRENGLQV